MPIHLRHYVCRLAGIGLIEAFYRRLFRAHSGIAPGTEHILDQLALADAGTNLFCSPDVWSLTGMRARANILRVCCQRFDKNSAVRRLFRPQEDPKLPWIA